MTNPTNLRKTARFAGVLYVAIIIAGIYAQFFVRNSLIVPDGAIQTATNLAQSEQLFRTAIAADLVMIVADIAIGILFFVLLRSVNRALSLLAAFFRLVQAATLGANLLMLYLGLQLSSSSPETALIFLNAHAYGYALALVFFGFSLLTVGTLLVHADYFPSVLGILLVIAAVGYIADGFARTLLVDYAAVQPFFDYGVFLPAFVGELATAVYLLVRGIRPKSTPSALTTAPA